MTDTPEPQLVMIDGREALAAVLVMPMEDGGGVTIDASAKGMSREDAAYVLRHVAEMWCPEDGEMARLQEAEQLLINQVEAVRAYAAAMVITAKVGGGDGQAWLDLLILLGAVEL